MTGPGGQRDGLNHRMVVGACCYYFWGASNTNYRRSTLIVSWYINYAVAVSRGEGAAERMYGSAARISWWPRKWSLWLLWLHCLCSLCLFWLFWSLTKGLGFVLPGNYPDYRGNYPYSPILGRYHQNNGNAVTLSARWVTSCIRGNYPWPKPTITMAKRLLSYFDLSFGKETIPIDVHTTSIDDCCHLYSSMMMVLSPPGL